MKVQIKKLHPDAVVPKYQTKGSAGFDLAAIEDGTIYPGQTALIKTGLAVAVPLGYELQVRPRSGTSLKTPFRVANAPGTVDSDYRGEVCIIMTNIGTEYKHFFKGERLAQGVITEVFQAEFDEVTELDSTERGSGGFGSTGK